MSCAFLSSEDLTRAKQEGCLWVVSKAQAFIRREQAKKSATTIDSEQVLHDVETRFVALKDEHAAAQKRLDTLVESNAQLQKKAEAAEKALRAMQVRQPCARARAFMMGGTECTSESRNARAARSSSRWGVARPLHGARAKHSGAHRCNVPLQETKTFI